MTYETSLSIPVVKVRYFAWNCLEIKTLSGKTLVVDPCLGKEGQWNCGYDVDDLEGCDYVFVNHAHADHCAALGKLYDRFHPFIMAHACTTFDLAHLYDIPYVRFLPFTTGDEFDFDAFKLKVVMGRHNNITPGNFNIRPSGKLDELCNGPGRQPYHGSELERRLGNMGSMFGNNFLMTLNNNFKIGFYAGNAGMEDPQERNEWSKLRPDIIFAHRAKFVFPDRVDFGTSAIYAEKMADILEITGARVLMPIHIEDAYRGIYNAADYVNQVNAICEKRNLNGRMMFLERGQWYQFSTGVQKL